MEEFVHWTFSQSMCDHNCRFEFGRSIITIDWNLNFQIIHYDRLSHRHYLYDFRHYPWGRRFLLPLRVPGFEHGHTM